MASEQKSIYIDEDTGKDDSSADGSKDNPYKTLLHAHIQHPPTQTSYFTRKSQTGQVAEADDESTRLEYKPATSSALKKATRLFEQHQKKLAKSDARAIREK